MTRYGGAAEAISSKYVLLSVGRKVGVDKNGGNRRSADGGGCGGRAIVNQRNNLARFTMHGKLTASRAELAAEKVVINRGRGRGSGPAIPSNWLSCPNRGFWGGWRGERRLMRTMTSWGIWNNARGRGGPPRRGRGSPLQ